MAAVTVRIPSLLAQMGDGRTSIPVEAESVSGALDALFGVFPQLRVHVFDESGAVRRHVAIFHNGRNSRTSAALAGAVAPGDVVTVLQSVSGG